MLVDTVSDSMSKFPSHRPDGTSLQFLDYMYVSTKTTLPKTISGVTISSTNDTLFYLGTNWILVHQDIFTKNIIVSDSTTESLSGTAINQQQVNQELRLFSNDMDFGTWD